MDKLDATEFYDDEDGIEFEETVEVTEYIFAEPKNSNIEWEKADDETAKIITGATKEKYKASIVVSRIFLPIFVIVPMLMLFGFLKTARNDSSLFFLIMFPAFCILFATLGVFLNIKSRIFHKGNKYNDIWFIRTVCIGREMFGMIPDEDYYAVFDLDGTNICCSIFKEEYDANPTGKDYIIYKVGKKFGKNLVAIPEEYINQHRVRSNE